MAQKPAGSSPRQPANLATSAMRRAIPLFEKRVEELQAFDPTADEQVEAMQAKLNDTAMRVYAINTIEYRRLETTHLACYMYDVAGGGFGVRLKYIQAAVKGALAKFKNEIEMLQERLGDEAESAIDRSLRAYDGLSLHSEIERAASSRFKSHHYADAVEAAVKALNSLVRLRSGLEIDGSALMQRAFGGEEPLLKFNLLRDQSDKDEQKGYMFLYSGAVSGLRNPRAHGFVNDKPERALEFIAFVSLLAKLLDEAQY